MGTSGPAAAGDFTNSGGSTSSARAAAAEPVVLVDVEHTGLGDPLLERVDVLSLIARCEMAMS